jgi:hypothetical protein
METKICKKCNFEKKLCEFDKRNDAKDGYSNRCKVCRRVYYNEYNNKIINLEKNRKRHRENYWNNHEKELKRTAEKHKKNSEKEKEYRKKNRIKINERIKKRYTENEIFRLRTNMKNRVKLFLNSKQITKKNTTFEIVGCNPKELKEHIEKQFKIGMSWENYGYYGWHIDHIIPLSSAKTEEDVYRLSHYTNLQPLWGEENYKKGNKLI